MNNFHDLLVSERFNDWAGNYDKNRITSWFRHYQEMALSKMVYNENSAFLEVGCGTGWAIRYMAEKLKNGKCCGIDISPNMISVATQIKSVHSNIEFKVASSESIPYPDNTFDFLLCTNSFHHYKNPVQALTEFKRVLKEKASMVLLDPARDIFFPIWLQDFVRRRFERGHVKYYSTNELKELIESTGWTSVKEVSTVKKFFDHGKLFTGLMLFVCIN